MHINQIYFSALTFHKDSLIPKIEIAVGLDIGRVAHGFDHDEYYNSPIIYTVLTNGAHI